MKVRNSLSYSFILALVAAALSFPLLAQNLPPRDDDTNRPSKNGRTEGTIDGTNIIITYGRPHIKGRKVWGGLVGYGQVWRAGANEATVISFNKDVTVEGKKLPAGVYGFFMIPSEGAWTVIFNKTANQWGHFSYDASQDQLRIKVKPTKRSEQIEVLDYVIEGNKFMLRWGNLGVPIQVATAN